MVSSTASAVTSVAQVLAPELLLILSLIFGGCCSNVFALEVLIQDAPKSGNLVTLAQFLFVSLEGIRHQIRWDGMLPRWKRPVVPIHRWMILVTLFFIVSVMNNLALGYHISVPLHIIFRSGGLIINMIMGAVLLKKRYSLGQITGVICVTLGVIMATLDNANTSKDDSSANTTGEFLTGITLLVVAMVLSAGMGLYQEVTYKAYGKQWREGLFYTHFLALPFFLLFTDDIRTNLAIYQRSAREPLFTLLEQVPVLGAAAAQVPESVRALLMTWIVPRMWVYLGLNMVTQYVCIAGVNRMTALCTSLTLNLVLNLRKYASLVISVAYFDNEFGTMAKLGTCIVILGTGIYTWAGLPAKKPISTANGSSKDHASKTKTS
ncbi:UAA transporter [Gongronella butleri]|nr:UAA transporter [Gongronella butleri]